MGDGRAVYRVLVWKPEGKRPLERPSRGWEDNIKADLRQWDVGCMIWIERAEVRDMWRALVNAVIEPSGSLKCGEFLD
jgi:hypothetical protein